jgi:sensor histidine kinase regulating citrate/malate metabolism
MDSDNCDPVWRSLCGPRRRGLARHEDQKSFRAIAHTDSQTPKEETDTNSVARDFAETKESFSESIANRHAEEQIKAQESISHSNTGRITVGNRDSVRESHGNTRSWSRKKRLA